MEAKRYATADEKRNGAGWCRLCGALLDHSALTMCDPGEDCLPSRAEPQGIIAAPTLPELVREAKALAHRMDRHGVETGAVGYGSQMMVLVVMVRGAGASLEALADGGK